MWILSSTLLFTKVQTPQKQAIGSPEFKVQRNCQALQTAIFPINKNAAVHQLAGTQCLICPITGWSDRDSAAGEMPLWETITCSLYINSWRFSLEFCLISFFLLLFLKNLVTPAPVIWPTPRVRGWETPNKSDMRANWKAVFLAGLLQNTETDVKRHRGAAVPHCC